MYCVIISDYNLIMFYNKYGGFMNNRIFNLFFVLLPFVYLITALITRNLGVMFTPGIIIKFIFLLINIFIIFWGNSKYKKFSICTILFIIIPIYEH